MTQGPSLVQPILTRGQLVGGAARFIVGSGPLARRVLEQIPEPTRPATVLVDARASGCPSDAMTFREFCATVPRSSAVIYADDDNFGLTALQAIGQAVVYDAREFLLSTRYAQGRDPDLQSRRLVVMATVPRSGTHRICYFLFTLNELLGNGRGKPCSHKLYLYYVSRWGEELSRYRLSRTFALLRAQEFRMGHYLPPGALVALGENAAMTSLLEERAARFAAACARDPALAALSHTHRPWSFEPPCHGDCRYEVRYALVVRDVVGQLESILTLYELALQQCRSAEAAEWPLERLVAHCRERLRAHVLFSIDGLIPLIFREALAAGCPFVDVVLQRGHLQSLITDYAIQLYSATRQQERAPPHVAVRTFPYAEMVANEEAFFLGVARFLRDTALSDVHCAAITEAARRTSLAGCLALERELGHAISYNPGSETVFESGSHLTGSRDTHDNIRACREVVESRMRPLGESIRATLVRVLEQLRAAEPEAPC